MRVSNVKEKKRMIKTLIVCILVIGCVNGYVNVLILLLLLYLLFLAFYYFIIPFINEDSWLYSQRCAYEKRRAIPPVQPRFQQFYEILYFKLSSPSFNIH